ncbi:hypothetical protein GCM10029964_048800 [Kibdelosporangium lantanae]
MRQLHRGAVAAFGLRDGVTHLEVLRTPVGYLIGEISCRPGGCGIGDMLRLAYGVDIWQAHVDVSVGRPARVGSTSSGGVVVMGMLPATAGYVEYATPASELAALPGVLEVHGLATTGSSLADDGSSVVNAGLVYLRVPDEDAVGPCLASLERAFTLRVSPLERAA